MPESPHKTPDMLPRAKAGKPEGGISYATAEVIEWAAEQLCMHKSKNTIKRELRELLGIDISPNAIENILRQARAFIRERAAAPTGDFYSRAVGLWQAFIADEDLSPRDRMKAAEQLQNLLGIGGTFRKVDDATEDQSKRAQAFRKFLAEMDDIHREVPEDPKLNGAA